MAEPELASLSSLSNQRAKVLDHLRDSGKVDPSAIHRAQLVAGRTGQPVEQILNQLGSLSDTDLAKAYSATLGIEVWDPPSRPVALTATDVGVSPEFLRRARLVPIDRGSEGLTFAACDPLDREGISGLAFATNEPIVLLVARPADWAQTTDSAQPETPQELPTAADERRLEREIDQVVDSSALGAGARLVASVFEAAIARGASDIHFKPRRNDLDIRLRIDGRLVPYQTVSADLAAPAVSRVKVIANLDLGEKRLPQDGRTTFVIAGRQVDVRVATGPTVFGESAVLRILDRSSVPLDLDSLGLSPAVVRVLRNAAQTAHGLFLVTGPTGSGKTTTLYALLQTFAGSAKNVLSVEDPVEFHFEHVSQTQVAPQLGLTFARVLRSFLRQDPDVILVGEIRDPETAAVAIQAAMTGHLVLASVHANDALGVVPRLLDMGIEPYQLAAGFMGAAAQRLVRRLCPDCRKARAPNSAEIGLAETAGMAPPRQAFDPIGCTVCHQTGFKGRTTVSEAYLADEAVLRAIADERMAGELAKLALRAGLASMAADGVGKVERGETTFEEVIGAVYG